jgi:hypothetical protein
MVSPEYFCYAICIAVKLGRCVSKFGDNMLKFQIPARSAETSIRVCTKTGHYISEKTSLILTFVRLKYDIFS